MLEVLSIWLLYGQRTFVVANLGSRNAELLVIVRFKCNSSDAMRSSQARM